MVQMHLRHFGFGIKFCQKKQNKRTIGFISAKVKKKAAARHLWYIEWMH